MGKRKRSNEIQLSDIWVIEGLMEYILSFLLFENPYGNVDIFGSFYQLCQSSRKWSRLFFVDFLIPIISDQYDLHFWKYCLPKCKTLDINCKKESAFPLVFHFEDLQKIYIHSRCKKNLFPYEVNIWTCNSLISLIMSDVCISQQTVSLLAQKLICLTVLKFKIENDIEVSKFQNLRELYIIVSNITVNNTTSHLLLKDLPHLTMFNMDGNLEVLHIDNVPELKSVNTDEVDADVHQIMFESPCPHLDSINLGFNRDVFVTNCHYISLSKLVLLNCRFNANTRSIFDHLHNIVSLDVTERDLFLDIPWNHYQKLEQIALNFPSARSLDHLFSYTFPAVKQLFLQWDDYKIDFAVLAQFPNVRYIILFQEDDAGYVNFDHLFHLKHLQTVMFSERLSVEDSELLQRNLQKCAHCSANIIARNSPLCGTCKLITCDQCLNKSCK